MYFNENCLVNLQYQQSYIIHRQEKANAGNVTFLFGWLGRWILGDFPPPPFGLGLASVVSVRSGLWGWVSLESSSVRGWVRWV